MSIRVNRLHHPVTALGHGRRIGIWLQGCSIGCPGCASRDTWASDPAKLIEIDAVLAWCREREDTDGVTITGGEPFEQPEALGQLLDRLDDWRKALDREIDFLCYSGMPWKRLRRQFAPLLAKLDAIIPEPFAEAQPTDAPWRGSANQRLIPLSPLGRRRYSAAAVAESAPQRLQVAVADGQVWLIGIPGRGDLDRLVEAAERRGIATKGPSWNA